MANEHLGHLIPLMGGSSSAGSPSGGVGDPFGTVQVGNLRGIGFRPKVVGSVYYAVRLPTAVAVGTGLSFQLLLADDPNNASAGKVCKFGVTVSPLTSDTSTLDDTTLASSTEDSASITMPSTANAVHVATITQVVAHENSLAAGNWALVRIRRLGSNSAETHTGTVVLLGVHAYNT